MTLSRISPGGSRGTILAPIHATPPARSRAPARRPLCQMANTTIALIGMTQGGAGWYHGPQRLLDPMGPLVQEPEYVFPERTHRVCRSHASAYRQHDHASEDQIGTLSASAPSRPLGSSCPWAAHPRSSRAPGAAASAGLSRLPRLPGDAHPPRGRLSRPPDVRPRGAAMHSWVNRSCSLGILRSERHRPGGVISEAPRWVHRA